MKPKGQSVNPKLEKILVLAIMLFSLLILYLVYFEGGGCSVCAYKKVAAFVSSMI